MAIFNNTVSYLFQTAKQNPDIVALRDDHAKPPIAMTYSQMTDEVDIFGAGLSEIGIKKGSSVAFFADNQPRWRVIDYALMSIGAVSVPRGSDSAAAELWYIVQHSEATVAILQDVTLAKRFFEAGGANYLEKVVIIDPAVKPEHISEFMPANARFKVHLYDEILHIGRKAPQRNYDKQRENVSPADVATIVYTSGTTGIPKGVILTHANLISQLQRVDIALTGIQPGMLQLAMLPAWHAYERMAEYFVSYQYASTIVYTNKRHLKSDIANLKPAVIPCVPRIWEMIYDNIRAQVAKQPANKQKMFHFFVETGKQYIYAKRRVTGLELRKTKTGAGEYIGALCKLVALFPVYCVGKALIFKKIKNTVASNLIGAVSGGGSLATYIDDFFEVLDVPLLNGYGLTETSPVLSIRALNHNIRGTVGRPLRDTFIEIRSEDGAVLPLGQTGCLWAKGPQIMGGYYKNQVETDKVIRDGWLNTGDLAWMAPSGDIVISGRAKDTIVLSSGENIEPEPIEGVLRESAYITDVVVVGQDKKQLGALVYPSLERVSEALELQRTASRDELAAMPEAVEFVRRDLMQKQKDNGGFREYEIVSRIQFLDEPFSEVNGTLTQTLKPKRNPISKRYAHLIDAMFK